MPLNRVWIKVVTCVFARAADGVRVGCGQDRPGARFASRPPGPADTAGRGLNDNAGTTSLLKTGLYSNAGTTLLFFMINLSH